MPRELLFGALTLSREAPWVLLVCFLLIHEPPSFLHTDLLRAANYMDIKPLLDLACLKVTFMLNGKSENEVRPWRVSQPMFAWSRGFDSFFGSSQLYRQIREILNLPAMTEQEEAEARAQHPWIFEETTE